MSEHQSPLSTRVYLHHILADEVRVGPACAPVAVEVEEVLTGQQHQHGRRAGYLILISILNSNNRA